MNKIKNHKNCILLGDFNFGEFLVEFCNDKKKKEADEIIVHNSDDSDNKERKYEDDYVYYVKKLI